MAARAVAPRLLERTLAVAVQQVAVRQLPRERFVADLHVRVQGLVLVVVRGLDVAHPQGEGQDDGGGHREARLLPHGGAS